MNKEEPQTLANEIAKGIKTEQNMNDSLAQLNSYNLPCCIRFFLVSPKGMNVPCGWFMAYHT